MAAAGRQYPIRGGDPGLSSSFGTRFTTGCPADLDNGSGSGTRDGGVTIEELVCSLAAFEARHTAAMLSSVASTCRRHAINPQRYVTQSLLNLPASPVSRLDQWFPDQFKHRDPRPPPG